MTVAERLSSIIEHTDLDYSDVARVVQANPRTVSRWIKESSEPRWQVKERLLEFIAVMERLQQVINPKASHDWLYSPNPSLDFEKPVDLLRRGDFRRVLGVIDAIGEGVFM